MASSNRSSKFASFVLGVVFGMGICAGAAYFLTTGPLPFVDKVDKVTADVDPAEALAGGVDPNQKLNQSPDEMTAAGSEVRSTRSTQSSSGSPRGRRTPDPPATRAAKRLLPAR